MNTVTTKTYTIKSKAAAVVLGLLLGGLGLHRFYLGNIGLGFLYLFCLFMLMATPLFFLPGVVALCDVIYIAVQDKDYFQRESGFMTTEVKP